MAVEVQLAGSEEQPLEETVGPTEGWVACSAAACSVVGTVRERTVMAAAAEKAAGSAVEGDLAAVAGMQTEGVDLVLAVAVATAPEIRYRVPWGSGEKRSGETVGPTEGWVACSAAACSVVGTVRERPVMAAAAEKAGGSAVEGCLAAVAGVETEGENLATAVEAATALEIVIALETVVEHRWPGCSLLPAGADAASSSVASASP